MATLAATVFTLADWAKTRDPNDKHAKIVQMLQQTNEVLDDMLWSEGNLTTGHRTSIQTGLPSLTWRLLNAGVPTSKQTTAQIDFTCANLEGRSETDKDLADLASDTAAFRVSQATAFMEAMNQEMASTLFYGNQSTNPERFTGLAAYYADNTTAQSKENIITAGGSGSDNTSLWLVGWGPIKGIYPKGLPAGLTHEDLGVGDAFDSSNARFRAYMDRYTWKCGLAVEDWRYAVRIANIDVSDLIATEANQKALLTYMIQAIDKIPFLGMCRPAFYCNRTVHTALKLGALAKIAATTLGYEDIDGRNILTFSGIPVRRVDKLLSTESTVS